MSQYETLKAKIDDLNNSILTGKALEGSDKHYADNVEMQENDAEPFVGKELNRKREEEFFGSITEFRGASVKSVAVGDNVTMVLWHFDYTHKDWGVKKYDQVAIQEWENGLIVRERFIYKP